MEVFSNIDYTGPSLSGPMLLLAGGAGAGIGFNSISFNAGCFFLYGNGSLPPFAVPLPAVSTGDQELSLGAEINFGAGIVNAVDPGTPLAQFSLVAEPSKKTFTSSSNT